MSSCTAAEIAEKKRIAIEKLKARKAQMAVNLNSNKYANKPPVGTINSKTITSSSSTPIAKIGNSAQVKANLENKASSFLSAIKGSDVFVQRQQHQHSARESAHPYKRPSTEETLNKNFYKNASPTAVNDKRKPTGLEAQQKQLTPVFVKSVSCKVAMISPIRFEVEPSGFHAKLIDVFKSIPSRSYGNFKLFPRLCKEYFY